MRVFLGRFDTSIGPVRCASVENRLVRICLPGEEERSFFDWLGNRFPAGEFADQKSAVAKRLSQQLRSYLQRQLREFDLPLELHGTEFQKQVWRELLSIPYGVVISYAELARRIGLKTSFRAVGNANGANPLPIVIPCHRVIGANGKLVGYGGGLKLKSFLLDLEKGQDRLPWS